MALGIWKPPPSDLKVGDLGFEPISKTRVRPIETIKEGAQEMGSFGVENGRVKQTQLTSTDRESSTPCCS